MKTISILIPCYNEEENVEPIAQAVIGVLEQELPQYDYELVFIDNDSQDNTRPILRRMCGENPRIKAIFNTRNFGQFNSPYYGILQVTGDYSSVSSTHGSQLAPTNPGNLDSSGLQGHLTHVHIPMQTNIHMYH